jgi:hypothetical protein
MPEHDTPQETAPHGAAGPDAAPEPQATVPEAAAPSGLRRWMPRRRTSAAPAPGDDAGVPPSPDTDAAEGSTATPDPALAGPESPSPGPDEAPPRPRRRWGRRQAPAPAAADAADPPGDDAAGPAPVAADTETNPSRLRRRRKRLISDREVAVYHLGGLAFELYRRDLLSEDVLRRRAGSVALIDETVHDIDVRLEQLDSERREKRARRGDGGLTTAGNCLACRAPFQADARFCWQCGARITPPDPELDAQVTQIITAPRQ